MNDQITIFITTYERPDFLDDCLLSISNQTYKNFKVIILDNASKKNYESVISKYKYLNLQYIKYEKNIGSIRTMYNAYNFRDDNKYFLIFHDDDMMHPKFLEYSIKILINNPRTAWVASSVRNVYKPKPFLKINSVYYKFFSKKKLITEIFKGVNFAYGSLMYNRSNLNKLNFNKYETNYSIIHDRPLIIDFIKDDLCCIIFNQLVDYRVHNQQDSKTSKKNLNIFNETNLFLFYKKNMKKNLYNLFLYKKFTTNLIHSFKNLNNNNISIFKFLKYCFEKKIINIDFIFYYFFIKLFHIFKKLFKSSS